MESIDKYNEVLICKLYTQDEIPVNQIRKLAKCGWSTIVNILKKNNIEIRGRSESKRKYKLRDDNIFKVIDNSDKAYFLGLMYADGCISQDSLIFSLSEKDKETVDKFNNWLFSEPFKLSYMPPSKVERNDDKVYYRKAKWEIRFCNKTLINDLINLGCIRRKSLILKFPTLKQVPSEFLPDFIRGYFDGDGWLCLNKVKTTIFGIVSSLDFCENLQAYLLNTLSIKSFLTKRGKVYLLQIYRKPDILKIFSLFYNKNPKFYMERRKKKFDLVIDLIKSQFPKVEI